MRRSIPLVLEPGIVHCDQGEVYRHVARRLNKIISKHLSEAIDPNPISSWHRRLVPSPRQAGLSSSQLAAAMWKQRSDRSELKH
jgi:hypothetical protein